jgi:hypothetical protein
MALNREMMDRYLESQMPQYPQIKSLNEAKFLLESENRFAIYQIDTDTKGIEYLYRNMTSISRKGWKIEKPDYKMVYSGSWTLDDSLDGLFETFNINHPHDFTGHSMSVSDVIVIREDGELRAYFVDSFGFRELPDFLNLEQLRLKERAYALGKNEKGYSYLEIHACESGFDYTFYDQGYKDMDGGVYDNPEVTIDEAVCDILADEQLAAGDILPFYDSFLEQVEAAGAFLDEKGKEPHLEYYVAGCDEFHDMGAYYKSGNLQEMIEKYREILEEPNNLYLGCGLGLIYRDPDNTLLDESEVGIINVKTIRGDRLDTVSHMAKLPAAQEALEQLRSAFPDFRYYPSKEPHDLIYPKEMTTEQLASALNDLFSDFYLYDYKANFNPEEDKAAVIATGLRCGKTHLFMGYMKNIVDAECAESVRAEEMLEKLNAYKPDVPENMEPVVEVKFCENTELASLKYPKLSQLDKTVSDLDAELSVNVNEKTGLPEQSYRMYFVIYYAQDNEMKNIQGKINIGDGNGGIIGQLKAQTEIRLTDDRTLTYQKSKGEESFQSYMADLTDMQEHVLPFLQSFCSLEEREPERDVVSSTVAVQKRTAVPTPGSKKSIHDRLKSNKELIEKQQGKAVREKGVEVVV